MVAQTGTHRLGLSACPSSWGGRILPELGSWVLAFCLRFFSEVTPAAAASVPPELEEELQHEVGVGGGCFQGGTAPTE